MPRCYTELEELIYTFGGPWLFGCLLFSLLILLALVLSVARIKFVSADELPGPVPAHRGSPIDRSFPFLESLNEVLRSTFYIYFFFQLPFNQDLHVTVEVLFMGILILI